MGYIKKTRFIPLTIAMNDNVQSTRDKIYRGGKLEIDTLNRNKENKE